MPTIVTAMITAARSHPTAIHKPPKTIQRMFGSKDILLDCMHRLGMPTLGESVFYVDPFKRPVDWTCSNIS
jgi:hypothetical protein